MASKILVRRGTSTDRPTLSVGEFGLDVDSPYNLYIGAPSGNKLVGTSLIASITGTMGVLNVRDFGATGDGTTDDRPYVQAAIDFAEVAGRGCIYFPSGTYKMNYGATINFGSVTIKGDGLNSIIKMAAGATHNYAGFVLNGYSDITGTQHRVSNVKVNDLYIDMNCFNSGSTWGSGSPWGGIWAENIDNLTIRDVYVKNVVDTGINVRMCRWVNLDSDTIDTVLFKGAGNGINVVGLSNTTPAISGRFTSISNCKIIGSAFTETNNADAIYVSGFHSEIVNVLNCHIINYANGIVCEGGQGVGEGKVIVSNNIFENCRQVCLGDTGAQYNYATLLSGEMIFANNSIYAGINSTSCQGITLPNSRFIVSGNYIFGLAGGIGFSDGYSVRNSLGRGVISNNYIEVGTYDSSAGISIAQFGTGTYEYRNIVISGNFITGNYSTCTQSGINMAGRVSDILITGNVITGCGQQGIYSYCSQGTVPRDITISNNRIYNNGNGSFSNNSYGVFLSIEGGGATNGAAATYSGIKITNNYIGNTGTTTRQTRGVYLQQSGTANGNWIFGNDVSGNTQNQIFFYQGTAWVTNNITDYGVGPT